MLDAMLRNEWGGMSTFLALAHMLDAMQWCCTRHEKWRWNFTKCCTCHEKWHLTLLFSTLLYFILLYSTLLCSTLLYSTLLCSTPLCSTLLYSTLLSSTLLYSTLLCSALLSSPLLSSPLLYSTLLYSTRLCDLVRISEVSQLNFLREICTTCILIHSMCIYIFTVFSLSRENIAGCVQVSICFTTFFLRDSSSCYRPDRLKWTYYYIDQNAQNPWWHLSAIWWTGVILPAQPLTHRDL